MPSSPFILISTTIFWPSTDKVNDFWDARSEQGLFWGQKTRKVSILLKAAMLQMNMTMTEPTELTWQ